MIKRTQNKRSLIHLLLSRFMNFQLSLRAFSSKIFRTIFINKQHLLDKSRTNSANRLRLII